MLSESQQLLKDLFRTHAEIESRKTKQSVDYCMQKLLVKLGEKSGVGYKQFRDYTDEDIRKVLPILETYK